MLNRDIINQMKADLKSGGVRVITAPQLFPTPRDLCKKLIDLADIQPEQKILEPSAGTGNILKALFDYGVQAHQVTAVELNLECFLHLSRLHPAIELHQDDFLTHNGSYDRIVMNPPFEKGSDIKHIQHAFSLLNPGGRLVAICANGSRQQKAFDNYYMEPLPYGSFKESGTDVNTAIVVMDRRHA